MRHWKLFICEEIACFQQYFRITLRCEVTIRNLFDCWFHRKLINTTGHKVELQYDNALKTFTSKKVIL